MSATTKLGSSDLEPTRVGLGTNNFGRRLDRDASAVVVHAAIDAGINFFDTANIYGGGGDSERFLGAALQGRRDEVLVATKFGMTMPGEAENLTRGTREYILKSIDASLERLGMEYVDLYQLHTPDPRTPIAETLGALHEVMEAGKARHIGCSNFSAAQLHEAEAVAAELGVGKFVSVQNEYSWLRRQPENGVLDTCVQLGIGFVPYFPLASGVLTGKYHRGVPPPSGTRMAGRGDHELLQDSTFDIVERLEDFASRNGTTLLALAIGGLAAMPAVATVIAGATSAEQVRANVEAGRWTPTTEQLAEIRALAA